MSETTEVSSSRKQTRRSVRKFVDTSVLELKDIKSTRKETPVDVRESPTVSSEEENVEEIQEGVEEDLEEPQFQFEQSKSVSSSRKTLGEFYVFNSVLFCKFLHPVVSCFNSVFIFIDGHTLAKPLMPTHNY